MNDLISVTDILSDGYHSRPSGTCPCAYVCLFDEEEHTNTHTKNPPTLPTTSRAAPICVDGEIKKRHSAEIRASKIDNSTAFRAHPGIGPIHRVSEIDGYRVHITSIPEPPPPPHRRAKERGRHHPMERNLISIQSSARSPVSKGLLPCSRAWNSSFETKPPPNLSAGPVCRDDGHGIEEGNWNVDKWHVAHPSRPLEMLSGCNRTPSHFRTHGFVRSVISFFSGTFCEKYSSGKGEEMGATLWEITKWCNLFEFVILLLIWK